MAKATVTKAIKAPRTVKPSRKKAEAALADQPVQRAAPDFIGDFIGNPTAVAYFSRSLGMGRLVHAYLLVGPEHVGKTELARRVAASLLGAEKPERHPDFLLVERTPDPKTGKPRDNIAIAQIHELRGAIAKSAMGHGRKVAVIVGAEFLGREAANALLKTLEEPAGDAVLILTATSAEELMPTVRSRCQLVRLARVSRTALTAALVARGVAAPLAATVAALADGRPGRALTLAQDMAALADLIATRAAILAMPGLAVADKWQAVEKLIPPRLPFIEAGERAGVFLDLAAEILRDALMVQAGLTNRLVHADAKDQITTFATRLGTRRLERAALAVTTARARLAANVSPRAVLENFLLRV
jgi:DNA polymerase-3 subunit delta'